MKKRIDINNCKRNSDWFDKECKLAQSERQEECEKVQKTLKYNDSTAYCKARRQYKKLLYEKKKQFSDAIFNELIESLNGQKTFWDIMHRVQSRKT